MKFAVQVNPSERSGETPHYRSYLAPKNEWSSPRGMDNVTTLHELAAEGSKRHAKHNFIGQRKFVKMHKEVTQITKKIDGQDTKIEKEWQFYELGPYEWLTFSQAEKIRLQIGFALLKLGFEPHKDMFHIYAKTCSEWMLTALACASQSLTIVTAYDTLGIEGLRSSINDTGTKGILLDKNNLATLSKVLQDSPSIRFVIYRDHEGGKLNDAEKQIVSNFENLNGGIKVLAFSELLDLGKSAVKGSSKQSKSEGDVGSQEDASEIKLEVHAPKADEICCIMYTSGSTGPPKGVILKHSTVIGGVAGASGNVSPKFVHSGHVFLSILPLAHIFEFTAELATFIWGAALGYGNPRTISDQSVRNCKGDMRELRPSILIGVPAVFEAIKKGINAKVAKLPAASQKLFWGAYKLKMMLKSAHLPSSFLDSTIFKSIKDATGGRLVYLMNGGSPVSVTTRQFINTLIAPLIMGYGLTETNAMCAITIPDQVDMDTTGELVPAVTVKFVDVKDSGYFAKNNQGEIYVRGPAVSAGYYNNQKETDESYKDGWFITGDIGELTYDGKLKIIDRKKNLVKTLNGEYIAVERLEALYRSNKYVANICVIADNFHAKPVAVVVPLEPALNTLAESLGISDSESFVHNNKINNEILKSLRDTAKDCELKPAEFLAGIYLTDDEWTPENGFVTSAQKIQRKKIANEYKQGIEKALENA
ncbi:long-chain fatty acid-CoA ligase [Starmerella bacillaris]|uniref:Long-chain fatty acid-CoA ligase n=1 Tax=Starmerella bacillaris TaxID=1247836 RepID=A0AAV5RJR9_STABA|nr:long-chain fatty acid-CoA ligase [Starmerella bacillaris]